MTGGSYSDGCHRCDEEIGGADRFCPKCGAKQPWFTDDGEHVHVRLDFPLPPESKILEPSDYREVLKDEFTTFLSVEADVSVDLIGFPMTDGGLTEACPRCDGAGEFVEVERNGSVEAVKGVEALDRIRDGDWNYHGERECGNCSGYGRVDARTGEI